MAVSPSVHVIDCGLQQEERIFGKIFHEESLELTNFPYLRLHKDSSIEQVEDVVMVKGSVTVSF